MNCNDVSQLLDPFIDTELPPPMLLAVAKHAATCNPCDTAIRELTELRELVARDNAAAIDGLDFGNVWTAVEAGIDRHDAAQARARRIRSLPMWATMVAMAAGVLLWIVPPTQPTPAAGRHHAATQVAARTPLAPALPSIKQNVHATYIDRLKSQRAVDVRREPKGGTTVIWVNYTGEDAAR
jgi:anti-sigma factor RsiW